MQELEGKVAVVTGGASGIGLALARAFLAEGMKVVIGDVEQAALDAATAGLGGDVMGVVADVSQPESVQSLADATFDAHGACHVLCNNAGVGAPSANVWETTVNDWRWVHGVNVMGVVHGIQAFVPRMIAAGEPGYVVNSLYYALYYPVLALLHGRVIQAAMQSVSIALFEREFVRTGLIEQRFFQVLRRAFELKPKCSTPESRTITRGDVEALFADARDFLETVSREAASV